MRGWCYPWMTYFNGRIFMRGYRTELDVRVIANTTLALRA